MTKSTDRPKSLAEQVKAKHDEERAKLLADIAEWERGVDDEAG